jgi:uncharacterized protein YjaG (DUF416 family)
MIAFFVDAAAATSRAFLLDACFDEALVTMVDVADDDVADDDVADDDVADDDVGDDNDDDEAVVAVEEDVDDEFFTEGRVTVEEEEEEDDVDLDVDLDDDLVDDGKGNIG